MNPSWGSCALGTTHINKRASLETVIVSIICRRFSHGEQLKASDSLPSKLCVNQLRVEFWFNASESWGPGHFGDGEVGIEGSGVCAWKVMGLER